MEKIAAKTNEIANNAEEEEKKNNWEETKRLAASARTKMKEAKKLFAYLINDLTNEENKEELKEFKNKAEQSLGETDEHFQRAAKAGIRVQKKMQMPPEKSRVLFEERREENQQPKSRKKRKEKGN